MYSRSTALYLGQDVKFQYNSDTNSNLYPENTSSRSG